MIAKRNMIVIIRMVPEEKKAATELAEQMGISVSDVIRIALHEILQRNNIPYPTISGTPQAQITGEGRTASKKILTS